MLLAYNLFPRHLLFYPRAAKIVKAIKIVHALKNGN